MMSERKILYDHQVFSFQRYGGISRYYYELIKRAGDSARVPPIFTNNYYLSNTPYHSRTALPERLLSTRVNGLVNRVGAAVGYSFPYSHNRRTSLATLNRGDFDVFHPTYYDPYFLDHLREKPFVVTVHDMIHEIFPEHFSPGDRVSEWKRLVVPKADRIIAISESTKRDILTFFDVDPAKIEVIYHGNSLDPGQAGAGSAPAQPAGSSERYLLFVGDRRAYKNFYFFIAAVADTVRKEGIRVICSGGGSFSAEERLFLKQLNLTGLVDQRSVNDATLAGLYQNALAFVFPSLYEGFGIPVLEAFACGCPALLSNASSLPEVGGDAALYFPPKDKGALQDAVERIIHEAGLRERLKAKGFERCAQFSWEKTAKETLAVYRKIS